VGSSGAQRAIKKLSRRAFVTAVAAASVLSSAGANAEPTRRGKRKVYLVPNFHPASCGWLTTFSKERVYCANSYLDHLDRVRDDPQYEFVMSEVNNIVAIMNFQPQRIPELQERVREKRVELVNAYFLESTINLSGGEALARLGVEGLRWYEQVFGSRPRYSWNIDVCGTHDQMPQIASELGLDALIYTRKNPTGKTLYWSVSPDGSRILTLSPGHYSEAHPIFNTKTPLTREQMSELEKFFETKEPITPEGAPILVLAGADDYALAPVLKQYPSELLKQWTQAEPDREIRFSTLSKYVDAILPDVKSGSIPIPTNSGGTAYDFDSFWIENPNVKMWYRREEHALQAAEILATIASLQGSYQYPAKPFYDSWILMCLNMDRNTLWGSAGGMVFVDAKSWDAEDRFEWVRKTTNRALDAAGRSMLADGLAHGNDIAFFNPLNWQRDDPTALRLPEGKSLDGIPCEVLPDGSALCRIKMPAVSVAGFKLVAQPPQAPQSIDLPDIIETYHYSVSIDPRTGAITSLKSKSSGHEWLGRPANVIVAERPLKTTPHDDPGDHMPPRSGCQRLASSSDGPSTIQVTKGPVATTVEVKGAFYGGGAIRRLMRFYHDHPRIDFETELNDVPNYTVVVSEFPLSEDVLEIRRGIPFGFSYGSWAKSNPALHGWTKGIVPAVRWIDHTLRNGGGFALFDRGLTGREIDGRTPIIYLMNAEDKYAGYGNDWLSGKGKHILSYSALAHEDGWQQARIPHMAWEYNREPVVMTAGSSAPAKSFVETSGNLIMEAMRREGTHIEMRLVECLGVPGTATVRLHLPHDAATITDLTGRKKFSLSKSDQYTFPVRSQQIITLHFETSSAIPVPEPIKAWDPFVPADKLPALHAYDPTLVGHPPFGA
jgi:alpha-mannosidase